MKKLTTTLLLCAMLLSLAACGNEVKETTPADETTVDTTAVADNTESESETELTRENTPDDLPEKDFGGKNFTILAEESTHGYLQVDELTGEAVDDAIYNRNSKVSERFGAVVNIVDGGNYEAVSKTVNDAVVSGETTYDLVVSHTIQQGINAANGCYLPWNNVPYVDFTKPWWNSSMATDLNYKGYSYLAMGDFDVTAIMYSCAIFYNKELGEKMGLPDMYDVVREGQWTKDKFAELIADAYNDLNGDGTRDAEDQYGFALNSKEDINSFLWCFGKRIYERNADGTFSNVYYDEKLVNMVEWLYNFKYNEDFTYTDDGWSTGYDMLSTGNTLFSCNCIDQALWMRESEIDYAILPMPKWDDVQENYITPIAGGVSSEGVMMNTENLEMVGVLTEALNAESWRTVTPAIVDSALKYKGARDADSAEMIELIIATRTADFGVVYGSWNSPRSALKEVIDKNRSTDITSYYEKNKKSWDATMDSVFASFEELVEKNK